MNERQILEHRMRTLEGLVEGPAPILGPAANPIGAQLAGRWRAEARLIERLLADSPGDQVQETVRTWETRTGRFLESSNDSVPGWTDSHGNHWDARLVQELLIETRDRLERWSSEPDL